MPDADDIGLGLLGEAREEGVGAVGEQVLVDLAWAAVSEQDAHVADLQPDVVRQCRQPRVVGVGERHYR